MDEAKRVAVKLGTNTLATPDGELDPHVLAALADEVRILLSQGRQVLLISSGAIGAGRTALRFTEPPQDVPTNQALAAVGQHHLLQAWDKALGEHKIPAAQVLLTYETFSNRRSYLNLKNCLERLLDLGVVPILNENDTVSIDEIDATFGDNDRLAAMVAAKMEADLLVILTDVAGLYDRPPDAPGASPVAEVREVTDEVYRMAGGKATGGGRGGMQGKLDAVRMATEVGIPAVIAHGAEPRVLRRILDGEPVGTRFLPAGKKSGRRRWLLMARPQGKVHVDAGAAKALREGRHLLPVGITGVEGHFDVESVVELCYDGTPIAHATTGLSSSDLERCKGLDSEDARDLLGVEGPVNLTRKGRLALLD